MRHSREFAPEKFDAATVNFAGRTDPSAPPVKLNERGVRRVIKRVQRNTSLHSLDRSFIVPDCSAQASKATKPYSGQIVQSGTFPQQPIFKRLSADIEAVAERSAPKVTSLRQIVVGPGPQGRLEPKNINHHHTCPQLQAIAI